MNYRIMKEKSKSWVFMYCIYVRDSEENEWIYNNTFWELEDAKKHIKILKANKLYTPEVVHEE